MAEPNSGCHLWMADCFDNGYGKFWFERRSRKAHRVSWQFHNGPVPKGLSVLHKCDTPSCVNPTHLFVGTVKDNAIDMLLKGRSGVAKLSAHHIPAIRNDTRLNRVIAADYGVSDVTISHIKTNRIWKAV
jgi:hypothetical protein